MRKDRRANVATDQIGRVLVRRGPDRRRTCHPRDALWASVLGSGSILVAVPVCTARW